MMRRFFLLLFVSVSAFADAAPPVITSIFPAVGPGSGGTRVTIIGENLSTPPDFACLLPCPSRVTFGGVRATLLNESNAALVVSTPAHVPGSVDVTVITPDQRTVTVANAFLYADDSEANYERILLPIYLEEDSPGANGSVWQTQLWLRNNGANAITLAPWVCPPGALCIPRFPLTRDLQPRETLIGLPQLFQRPNVARILFVDRDGAKNLSTGLRLHETSRSTTDAGTEVPIVHESELLTTSAHLHGVPRAANFRVLLRIYELGVDDAHFHVSISEETPGVATAPPLSEFELRATAPETGTFRTHPAYVESALTPSAASTTLRIDIDPLTTGSRYWALVSITNNDTQRVTLVTPQ